MIAEIQNISLDIKTRKPIVSFLLQDNEIAHIEELKGCKLNLEVKKWYKKGV